MDQQRLADYLWTTINKDTTGFECKVCWCNLYCIIDWTVECADCETLFPEIRCSFYKTWRKMNLQPKKNKWKK